MALVILFYETPFSGFLGERGPRPILERESASFNSDLGAEDSGFVTVAETTAGFALRFWWRSLRTMCKAC